MQAESYCPYLRSLGLLLVKGPGGIAIWNDYSLFKRTSVLYGSSLKLARVSSSVNEAVFFYGPVFLFLFFFLSLSRRFLSITREERERKRKSERERPSTEDKVQNKIRVLVFYFPNLAATMRGNLNNFSFFHLVSMGNHRKLSEEFFVFYFSYIQSAAEITLKRKQKKKYQPDFVQKYVF